MTPNNNINKKISTIEEATPPQKPQTNKNKTIGFPSFGSKASVQNNSNNFTETAQMIQGLNDLQERIFVPMIKSNIDETTFFKDKKNCELSNTIFQFLYKSKWDLGSYMDMSLGHLIYIQFVNNVLRYLEKNKLLAEQEESLVSILAILSKQNSAITEEESQALSKKITRFCTPIKDPKQKASFFLCSILCSEKNVTLFPYTLNTIHKNAQIPLEIPCEKSKTSNDKLHMHKEAFALIKISYLHLLNKLKSIRENEQEFIQKFTIFQLSSIEKLRINHKTQEIDPRFKDINIFKELLKGLSIYHDVFSKQISKSWAELTFHSTNNKIESLKKQICDFSDFMEKRTQVFDKLISSFKNDVELFLPENKQRDLGSFLHSEKFKYLLEHHQELINIFEDCFQKKIENVLDNLNNIKKTVSDSTKSITKKISPNNADVLVAYAPTLFTNLTGLREDIANFQHILNKYTELAVADLNLALTNLPVIEQNDLADLSWCEEKQIHFPKKKKTKTKESLGDLIDENDPILEKRTIIFETNPETPPLEIIVDSLKTAYTSLMEKDLKRLKESSLKVVHQFNEQLQMTLETVPQDPDYAEVEKITKQECGSHLFLLSSNFDQLIHAIGSNDLEALYDISSNFYLNMHTVFEKLLQREYYRKHDKFFLDSHRLTDLLKELTEWKKVDGISQLVKDIDAATLWVRYPTYYKEIYPKESNRPEMLKHLFFLIDLSHSLRDSKMNLDEKTIEKLRSLSTFTFSLTQRMYECLFHYIKASGGKTFSKEMVGLWTTFLNSANEAVQDHLHKQINTTSKEMVSTELKDLCKPITDVLIRIKETKEKCQLTKTLSYGNPYIALGDIENWVERFLINMTQLHKCPDPIHTPSLFKGILGTQWIVEKSLEISLYCNNLPWTQSHDFRIHQQFLSINNSFQLDLVAPNTKTQKMKEESNKLALNFNCQIGFNYTFLYQPKDKVKWLDTLRIKLKQFPDYVKSNETKRDTIDEGDLSDALKEAIEVITTQVGFALQDMRKAQEQLSSINKKK